MTDDDRKELLAQALWMEHFGVTSIDPRWTQFSADQPNSANRLRLKAMEMLAVTANHKYHSLGWLYG